MLGVVAVGVDAIGVGVEALPLDSGEEAVFTGVGVGVGVGVDVGAVNCVYALLTTSAVVP